MGNRYAKLEKQLKQAEIAAQKHWKEVHQAIIQNQEQANADRKEFSHTINTNSKNIGKFKAAIKIMQVNLDAQKHNDSTSNKVWMDFVRELTDSQKDLSKTIRYSSRY